MHVILLIDRYLPSPLSSAKMFCDLATEMASLGNDVTVVSGDESLGTRCEIHKEGSVTVVRVRTGRIRHPSKVIRAVNEVRLGRLIWKSARKFFQTHPCDLVISYSPTIFWSGLVKHLKKLNNNCGSYLVLRDLFPQWALDAGLIRRNGPAFWFLRRQELRLYESADIIGVQSPANLDYFLTPALRGRYELEVLFNWVSAAEPAVGSTSLRTDLGFHGKVIFFYGGNLGVAQDIDNILRLAAKLKTADRIAFLLVGDGSEYQRIKAAIGKGAMTNVKLMPAVSQEEYRRILAECDVGLITLRGDLKTHNFPGKMLSYMEGGKPILASINSGNDLASVLHDSGAGFACINGDDEALCRYTSQLAADKNLRTRMGMNARKLLNDKFDVSSAAKQILSHFVARHGRKAGTASAQSNTFRAG